MTEFGSTIVLAFAKCDQRRVEEGEMEEYSEKWQNAAKNGNMQLNSAKNDRVQPKKNGKIHTKHRQMAKCSKIKQQKTCFASR